MSWLKALRYPTRDEQGPAKPERSRAERREDLQQSVEIIKRKAITEEQFQTLRRTILDDAMLPGLVASVRRLEEFDGRTFKYCPWWARPK